MNASCASTRASQKCQMDISDAGSPMSCSMFLPLSWTLRSLLSAHITITCIIWVCFFSTYTYSWFRCFDMWLLRFLSYESCFASHFSCNRIRQILLSHDVCGLRRASVATLQGPLHDQWGVMKLAPTQGGALNGYGFFYFNTGNKTLWRVSEIGPLLNTRTVKHIGPMVSKIHPGAVMTDAWSARLKARM